MPPIVLAITKDRDDPRMREPPARSCLTRKQREGLLIDAIGQHQLERDAATKRSLLRLPNLALSTWG